MSHIIECIEERDSANDVGVASSMELNIDKKENMLQLITGNFKRIQEGLRVVEENLKVLGYYDASKLYESFRFKSYNIEKEYRITSYNVCYTKLLRFKCIHYVHPLFQI